MCYAEATMIFFSGFMNQNSEAQAEYKALESNPLQFFPLGINDRWNSARLQKRRLQERQVGQY